VNTSYWTVDKHVNNFEMNTILQKAVEFIQKGEVVAFPTETVYGLGADATSNQAVIKIFEAKGRPSDNPLIVHISPSMDLTELVTEIPEVAHKWMEAFWPGPLTIIFNKKPDVFADTVTAGLETVGIRMPDHPIALALIEKANCPIAAPSANRSGKPSPTTATHVKDDLDGRVAGIVDGGETGVGVESTVVDCTSAIPIILRPGGITKEELERVGGQVDIDPNLQDGKGAPKSPGMKYQHYAPNAPLFLMDGPKEWIQEMVDEKRQEGIKVGILTTEEQQNFYQADSVLTCGRREELMSVAQSLYDTLRRFNQEQVDVIYSEVFPDTGVGLAIMNRLEKAAGFKRLRP
jgi:L-threonylcarbamoyladenylate synthase